MALTNVNEQTIGNPPIFLDDGRERNDARVLEDARDLAEEKGWGWKPVSVDQED